MSVKKSTVPIIKEAYTEWCKLWIRYTLQKISECISERERTQYRRKRTKETASLLYEIEDEIKIIRKFLDTI
jgi:hypothetical protein